MKSSNGFLTPNLPAAVSRFSDRTDNVDSSPASGYDSHRGRRSAGACDGDFLGRVIVCEVMFVSLGSLDLGCNGRRRRPLTLQK